MVFIMRFFVLMRVIIFVACNQKIKESSSTEEADTFVQREEIIKAKKNLADTLAMPFEVLEKFLPVLIEGYQQEGTAVGETHHEHGMSWSVAKKTYKQAGKTLNITLADYNGAYGLYAGAAMVLTLDKVDDHEEKAQSVYIKNNRFKGWESYKKSLKEALVIVAIDERFLLTVEATDQKNTEVVKAIVEKMDLETLMNQ